MLKRTYIKISSLMLLFMVSSLIGLALFLPKLVDINAYRDDIIDNLQHILNRKVDFSRCEFSMRIVPTFTFDNVAIKEADGRSNFITAKHIRVRLALFPLLEKRVVLRDVDLEETFMRLERYSNGRLNIFDLLVPRTGGYQLQLRRVQIEKGILQWRDRKVQKQDFVAEVRIHDLVLNGIYHGHKGTVKLDCEFPTISGDSSLVLLSGAVKLPPAGRPFAETELDIKSNIKKFDPGYFWPYYGQYIPFGPTGGRVDLTTSFEGSVQEFYAKGKLGLANVVVTWPSVFHHPVNPRMAQLEYEFKRSKNSIEMPVLRLAVDGLKARGSCRLLDINTPDMRITANMSSEPFVLEKVRQWIPYGVIAKDASQYIEEHIIGGLFRLETGVLDGRISQISHMDKGTNYNVLRIRGRVEKGVLSYGPKVPVFTNIKAVLDLMGKDFIISQATATFGSSPFRLEGRITDYPLLTPCQYPFQMEMAPHMSEVAWLARLAGANKLNYSGTSRLLLRGSGMTSSYNLSGEWDLKSAAYAFPGAIRKPVGTRNTITFSTLFLPSVTKLNSLSYTLPPISLSTSAQLTCGEHPYLAFELQSNQFMLNEAVPILSILQPYHPRGRMQAHIKGSGNPIDFSTMDYSGSVSLNSFAFQPSEKLRPVSNINGAVIFKGNSLETSNITVNYGTSLVSAKGKIKNLKNPEAEIILSAPDFYLHDVLSTPSRPHVSIRNMFISLLKRDDTYTIRKFSGQLNSSSFSITGNYKAGSSPVTNISVVSPYLDFNELLMLAKAGAGGSGGSGMDLKFILTADSARYEKVQLTQMKLALSRESGVFYIQGLDATLYGGKLSAKGRIASDDSRNNRYDLSLNLERVGAERFFQALNISRKVTGLLNLEGNITARGSSLTDLKQSALGNLRMHLEKGTLKRFNVLSKMFSILNFSQLLKFQLPDMVNNGMPYNEIKASFSIRDGVVATRDMFINGDAINISVVGSANIVKEELDFIIGVQPLQTVDKIVNRIPVVGWLLTGKGKAILTAYFDAKGKWSDPKVSAIPVKSMTKGTLNVFRRMFELPMKLLTDTGEVLLGF